MGFGRDLGEDSFCDITGAFGSGEGAATGDLFKVPNVGWHLDGARDAVLSGGLMVVVGGDIGFGVLFDAKDGE